MSDSPGPDQRPATADAAFRELLARVVRLGRDPHQRPRIPQRGQADPRARPRQPWSSASLPQRLVGCSGPGAWISPGLAAARFLYLLTGRRDLRFIAPFSGGVRKFSADGDQPRRQRLRRQALRGPGQATDQVRRCAQVITGRPNTKRAAATLFPPYTGR